MNFWKAASTLIGKGFALCLQPGDASGRDCRLTEIGEERISSEVLRGLQLSPEADLERSVISATCLSLAISLLPRLAIFELSGTWQASTPPEPDGWMKMTGCRPVFYYASSRSYLATPANRPKPCGMPWDIRRRSVQLSFHCTRRWDVPARLGCGDWVWCHWNEHECRWQVLAPYEDHWRFRLLSQLSRCGSASAQLVLYQNGKWCPVDLTFTVYDSLGVVCPDLCRGATSGEMRAPVPRPIRCRRARSAWPSTTPTAAGGKSWCSAGDAASRPHPDRRSSSSSGASSSSGVRFVVRSSSSGSSSSGAADPRVRLLLLFVGYQLVGSSSGPSSSGSSSAPSSSAASGSGSSGSSGSSGHLVRQPVAFRFNAAVLVG